MHLRSPPIKGFLPELCVGGWVKLKQPRHFTDVYIYLRSIVLKSSRCQAVALRT
jgi:hypothetical protein